MSANTLHRMLRDSYYIGYVVWKGEIHAGRHEPLIEPQCSSASRTYFERGARTVIGTGFTIAI
ncbi:hypothetical protein D5S18_30180 [Nocardia panacis]|uniref:Recombinase domain-containing protein n=1 Tax=Nocardia panacis TaxID=2340916 RepID=A0A3A4KLF8_9NOCA|nr:hypothetical protein D5S18_30180 [Nocardia panacis]